MNFSKFAAAECGPCEHGYCGVGILSDFQCCHLVMGARCGSRGFPRGRLFQLFGVLSLRGIKLSRVRTTTDVSVIHAEMLVKAARQWAA